MKMAEKVLSQQELDEFHRRGYLRITDALTPEFTAKVQNYIWERFREQGVLREDPATWASRNEVIINKIGLDNAVETEIGPKLAAAVNQLLGEETWRPLKTLGGLLMTLPKNPPPVWELTSRLWHTDNDPHGYLDGLNELMLFTFYSDVAAHGGGTLVLSGSHNLLAKWISEGVKVPFDRWHPYLEELTGAKQRTMLDFMEKETDVFDIPAQVVELTGEPGDAILCHPDMFHATSINSLAVPRIMRRTNFRHKKL